MYHLHIRLSQLSDTRPAKDRDGLPLSQHPNLLRAVLAALASHQETNSRAGGLFGSGVLHIAQNAFLYEAAIVPDAAELPAYRSLVALAADLR